MVEVVFELVLAAFWYGIAGPIICAICASVSVLKNPEKTWSEHFIAFYKLFPDIYPDLTSTKKSSLLGLIAVLIVLAAYFSIGWTARNF